MNTKRSALSRLTEGFLTIVGTLALTLVFFLVLPLIQAITQRAEPDTLVREVSAANLPTPPPPPEDDTDQEEEEEESKPELREDAPLPDLSQLELALDPSLGGGLMGGDFALDLSSIGASSEDLDSMLTENDLDQLPRVIFQPSPSLSPKLKKLGGGKVVVKFIVDERGRVQHPVVQDSPNPAFNRPALDAVKKWRFEPGKRNGEAVPWPMRVPITFPKG